MGLDRIEGDDDGGVILREALIGVAGLWGDIEVTLRTVFFFLLFLLALRGRDMHHLGSWGINCFMLEPFSSDKKSRILMGLDWDLRIAADYFSELGEGG